MNTLIRTMNASALAALLTVVAGCESGGQAWSTKADSIYSDRPPTLNVSVEPLPVDLFDDDDERQNPVDQLRTAAVNLLVQASEAPDPLLRANAIEALHFAPEKLQPVVQRGLADDNRGVRFIAAMTLGKFQMRDLSHLAYPLLNDPSPSVQAAAIYAMSRCGEPVDMNPLGEMLKSSNPEVKANAAMVLGELGNPSAAPMLRNSVGRGLTRVSSARAQVVDLQIAEAMVKLGDERQLEVIRASLFAPAEQGELVALACLMVGRLHDARAVPNLLQLAMREGDRRSPAEVRMAATYALAIMHAPEVPIDVPMDYARHRHAPLRAQAAMTLGAIARPESLDALRRLLSDSDAMVQVSAAGGILRHGADQTPELAGAGNRLAY